MEDMVKMGQTMGYNMKGCINNIEDIIKSQGVNEVLQLATRVVLCVWDQILFRKDNSTIFDYFIMVRGEWIPNSKKIMIIAVYAPQELSEKKMLWDYLTLVINNWRGKVIIMGDFNEVRKQEERYEMIFNARGADAFNLFISNAGLVSAYPNISAITLDRYLSDHRLILFRESNFDFGPTPFRFFQYWFDIEGFAEFVKTTWINAQVTDHNAMGMFMKKLKFLKGKIREWIKVKRINSRNHKVELKEQLAMIDKLVDKGEWDCRGWNTKYYHGTLNKQRNQLAIRGVLVDGIWTESPELVKNEFLCHFKNRFDKPQSPRIMIDMDFPIQLSLEQHEEMECNITREEIKRAVWDCGTDKSPRPDGFTFGFYRRFWCVIENDVVESVNVFFQDTTFPKGGNASFIALIPKSNNANMVKDFRPITLIGSLYKIIAKILAKRLVFVLGNIGDPLSPLLFLLVMESLHLSVQRVVGAGLFTGKKVVGIVSRAKSWEEIVNNLTPCYQNGREKRYPLVGDISLKYQFPHIYALESDKKISVATKLVHDSLAFSLRRIPRGGIEQVQYNELQRFTEASIRRIIDDTFLPSFSSKTRWVSMGPIKVNIIAWKVKIDCLPTRLNISRRGMNLDSILCPIYDKEVESSNHLFFACQFTREILSRIAIWCYVHFIEMSSYKEWLLWI
nr:RNA-directed DNA polymerase, eukaryota [Tanacetum cinerariifolium]